MFQSPIFITVTQPLEVIVSVPNQQPSTQQQQATPNAQQQTGEQQHFRIPLQFTYTFAAPPPPQSPNASQQQQGQQQGGQQIPFFFVPMFGFPHPQHMMNWQDILQRSFDEQKPQGPPRTSKDFLEKLPVFKYTEQREQHMKKSHDSCVCAVCQCDFEKGDELLQLPCQHVYHKDCIMPWMKEHNTCAVCRFELETADPEQEKQRRKRMEDQYSKEGLQVMELGMEVENLFYKFDELVQRIQTDTVLQHDAEKKREYLANLNKFDGLLMQKLLRLDTIITENSKVKEQKRSVIAKIQSMQALIDEWKLKM